MSRIKINIVDDRIRIQRVLETNDSKGEKKLKTNFTVMNVNPDFRLKTSFS